MGCVVSIRTSVQNVGAQRNTGKTAFLCAYYDGAHPASIPRGTPLMIVDGHVGGIVVPQVATPALGADQPTTLVVAMADLFDAGYYWFACEGEAPALVTYDAAIAPGSTLKVIAGGSSFIYDGGVIDDSSFVTAHRQMESRETMQPVNLLGNPVVIPAS